MYTFKVYMLAVEQLLSTDCDNLKLILRTPIYNFIKSFDLLFSLIQLL